MEGMSDGEIGGYILDRRGLREGYAVLEGGAVADFREGRPDRPVMDAVVIRGLVDCHTHCADYGLEVPGGMSLQELVAPPDGLKHRYLREAPREELEASMRAFSERAGSLGVSDFIDFREGGLAGCEMLRSACPGATILGRPVSPEFDPAEAEAILGVADGFGLPSVTDMPMGYCEDLADAARSRGRPLAIHASERVREDIDSVLSLDPAMVVHMCAADRSDISKCAEAEVPIAVCPGSNAYFGIEAPVADMLGCGATVLLGTDNGMLRPPDMLAEASLLMRLLESRGAPGTAVWDVLAASCGKILYQEEINGGRGTAGRYAVLPLGRGPDDALRNYRGGAFGLEEKTKEREKMVFDKILVPTDGSENTKASVRKAFELAKLSGGKVTALYVLDQTVLTNMPMDTAVMNVYNSLEKEGKDAVDFVKAIGDEMGVETEMCIKEGTPVKVILEMSEEFDLIVMGTLGRTGMSKLLMGSVAERVVRGSSCPVLVVRASEAGN